MSTFAIGAIINKAVSEMPDNQAYVNVGVWNGFTFLSGLINNQDKKCIGIDNFSEVFLYSSKDDFIQRFNEFKTENNFFYEMDYLDYFKKVHTEKIGVYLYDGEHSYQNQLKGLEVAEPFFAENCIILIDDTNEASAKKATVDFVNSRDNKYKIIFEQDTCWNGHPTFWNGLMILQKVK